MSASSEILAYINAIKWPVVVVGGVYYFRASVTKVLERISSSSKGSISGPGGTSVSWDNTLKQVDAALDEAQKQAPPVLEAAQDDIGQPKDQPERIRTWVGQIPYWPGLKDLAHVSPQSAVVLSFTQLELALREVAKQQDVGPRAERMGAIMLARQMELAPDIQQALRQLSELRNEVIHHNAEPDENMAADYVDSAERLYIFLTTYADAYNLFERPPEDTSHQAPEP